MKPAEIQNFQRVFFLAHLAKNCNFMKLENSNDKQKNRDYLILIMR